MLHPIRKGCFAFRSLSILISHASENQQFQSPGDSRGRIQIDIEDAPGLGPVRTGQVLGDTSASRQAT
jgi:hypothetical protein